MIFSETSLLLITASFCVTLFSSILGMGGGIILLAIMTLIVPTNILIPLHALLVLGGLISRTFVARSYIDKTLFFKFAPALVVGSAFGAFININIPNDIFLILLGNLMLLIVWMPKFKYTLKIPEKFIGFSHGIIATVFGSGGFIQAAFTRIDINKHARVATFAALMLSLNITKVVMFTGLGTSLIDYIGIAILCMLVAYPASLIGRKCLDILPENYFLILFKTIVTLLAIRIIATAIM